MSYYLVLVIVEKTKVELYAPNYAIKSKVKHEPGVDVLNFSKNRV